MADFESWGPAASGPRLVDFDRLKATQALGEIAMQPVEMELKKAQTGLAKAHAADYETKAEQSRRMQAALAKMSAERQAGGAQQTQQDQNPLWGLANAMMEIDPKVAGQVANQASLIDYRKVETGTQQARQTKLAVETKAAQFDLSARELGLTTDEESMGQALVNFEKMTGMPSGLIDPSTGKMYPGIKFSMGIRDMMVDKLMSAKDTAQLAESKRRNDIYSLDVGSKAANREFWQNFENLQKRADTTRKPATEKAGGDVLKPEEVKAGSDLVMAEYPGLRANPEEARVQGRALIERAKQIRSANPALSVNDSRRLALSVMRREGVFDGQRGTGKGPESALPIPDDKNFVPDRWYKHPTKGAFFFDGQKWLSRQEYQLRRAGITSAEALRSATEGTESSTDADDDDDTDED